MPSLNFELILLDKILKEGKSSDDLKKYQECAKKLDECSKNLLRLCQYTNQGIYDDDIERAANEILRKEEAEAKRIAEELRHQKSVLNRTQGRNRNLHQESSSRNLLTSSKTLKEGSAKELMYSGSSTKNPNFSDKNPCDERPLRRELSGMGEVPVCGTNCDVTLTCTPCSGSNVQSREAGNYTFLNCEMKQPSPCGEQRQPADYYRSNMTSKPAYDTVTSICDSYGFGNSSSRQRPGITANTVPYGPCTDAATGPNYFGPNPYGNQENDYQFQDRSRWRDFRRPNPGDLEYTDGTPFSTRFESTPLKRGYFPINDPSLKWSTHQNTMVPPRDFNSLPPSGLDPTSNACDPLRTGCISQRAKSQTTQLTSNGKSPIHIVITGVNDDSQTTKEQQKGVDKRQPCREPVVTDFENNQAENFRETCDERSKGHEGDSYLSKEDADRFLQCVLNCWNQINKKAGTPKNSKITPSSQVEKNRSKSRLIEFCSNLSSQNLKKNYRKKHDNSKPNKNNEECQPRCFICTPAECSDGDGHSSTRKESIRSRERRKGKKDWQAECQKIFKEFSAYKKRKAKKLKETSSKGADPCYKTYEEMGSMNQDPCTDYINNTQDTYEPCWQEDTIWPNSWGNEFINSPTWGYGWGSQAPLGETNGNYGAWSKPQNLICSPANQSPATSRTSSQTNLKTTSSGMDTPMLLAIARAAINLSMEQQKGDGAVQKDKRRNSSDDEDEEDDTSFCDMLESIFGQ